MALVVPLIGTAAANHPDVCLDVDPETQTDTVGETVEITATLRDPVSPPEQGDACTGEEVNATNGAVNIDFRIEGPNDPNPENTSGTADLSCDIVQGTSSCTVSYEGLQTGTDLVRGWVDHDKVQSTVEADQAEERDDSVPPGGTGDDCSTGPEPPDADCTDVVQVIWEPGEPAAVDCDDSGPPNTEREVNPSGEGARSNETYTCTITDERGNPHGGGHFVYGEVENGVNDPDATDGPSYESPDYACETGSDGSCTIQVTQNEGETGTAEICFWIDPQEGTAQENPTAAGRTFCGTAGAEPTNEAQSTDGTDSPNDEADQVEKTWEQRRASAIDAEPESDTNSPGQDHTITATVYDQFGDTFRGNTVIGFEFFQGSPRDADGNTPASPDLTCTTSDANSCAVTYTSQTAGVDLVCVYPNTETSRPNMVGTSTNGTCDGEGLTDADDDPAAADPPTRDENERVTDDQDVVQKRWVDPGTATRLDCTPETDSNPTGSSHTITCTARNQANNVVGGVNVDAEATGANDPDNNSDNTSPDFTCTTDDNGNCSFTHGPGTGGTGTTSQPGTTTYRAWIDQGNNDTVSEADNTEGRDETATPGNEGEPDNTDVVTKAWVGDARRINCEPETATNATGTNHTVTCTVSDAQGTPVSNESVTFTETGAGDISGSSTDTTDQNGQATVVTTSNEAGQQTITGTLTDDTGSDEPNNIDECDRAANDPSGAPAGECSDSVNKTWTEAPRPACSDEIDNDGDNLIDFPNDPGCTSAQDTSEANNPPQCSDGVDNDDDGQTDFPADDGCQSSTDNTEGDFPEQEFGGETGQRVDQGACAGFTTGSVQANSAGTGLVIVGTNGDDALQGSNGNDLICALDGEDTVNGDPGNDTIWGGGGRDSIEAGDGDDDVRGEGGRDLANGGDGDDEMFGGRSHDNLSGGADADVLRGEAGWDTLKGNGGNDRLIGAGGRDVLQGGGGNDTAVGGGDDDVIRGYRGNDILRAGGGDDVVKGFAGRDRLFGNAGSDFLSGGPGRDRCRGGSGNDTLRRCNP